MRAADGVERDGVGRDPVLEHPVEPLLRLRRVPRARVSREHGGVRHLVGLQPARHEAIEDHLRVPRPPRARAGGDQRVEADEVGRGVRALVEAARLEPVESAQRAGGVGGVGVREEHRVEDHRVRRHAQVEHALEHLRRLVRLRGASVPSDHAGERVRVRREPRVGHGVQHLLRLLRLAGVRESGDDHIERDGVRGGQLLAAHHRREHRHRVLQVAQVAVRLDRRVARHTIEQDAFTQHPRDPHVHPVRIALPCESGQHVIVQRRRRLELELLARLEHLRRRSRHRTSRLYLRGESHVQHPRVDSVGVRQHLQSGREVASLHEGCHLGLGAELRRLAGVHDVVSDRRRRRDVEAWRRECRHGRGGSEGRRGEG
mmetsp:Transcript_2622/g.6524  ORF Transcript_2622/g.6524 Transcript_2622/m.6524 type:complete len:373 (+) Transcript_2622:1084-2202(+)